MSKSTRSNPILAKATATTNLPTTSGEPATQLTNTPGDAAVIAPVAGATLPNEPLTITKDGEGEPIKSDAEQPGASLPPSLAGQTAPIDGPDVSRTIVAAAAGAGGDATAKTPTGLPAGDPVASLPVGVAGSPVTRRDVPETDQTETAHGSDAELEDDGSLPPPQLGGDDDDADTIIGNLPIGVAGSLRTRADVVDGDAKKPAEKKTGPDQPYRVISLVLPIVDMHGYAKREFFLGAEDADTLRDIAAGLASVGEKLDGSIIDRPEKAIVWLLRRVRELSKELAEASQ